MWHMNPYHCKSCTLSPLFLSCLYLSRYFLLIHAHSHTCRTVSTSSVPTTRLWPSATQHLHNACSRRAGHSKRHVSLLVMINNYQNFYSSQERTDVSGRGLANGDMDNGWPWDRNEKHHTYVCCSSCQMKIDLLCRALAKQCCRSSVTLININHK